MNKIEFISKLKLKLSNLPSEEVEDRINFYVEMIEDRIEEGLSEEQAIQSLGSIDDIAEQIVKDIPLLKAFKGKIKRNRAFKRWELALLIIGSPIWFSLIIALFSVALSLYVTLWAVVISLWAVFVACIASSVYLVVLGVISLFKSVALGFAYIGLGVIFAGFIILLYYACKPVTKWAGLVVKKLIFKGKKRLINKEAC